MIVWSVHAVLARVSHLGLVEKCEKDIVGSLLERGGGAGIFKFVQATSLRQDDRCCTILGPCNTIFK